MKVIIVCEKSNQNKYKYLKSNVRENLFYKFYSPNFFTRCTKRPFCYKSGPTHDNILEKCKSLNNKHIHRINSLAIYIFLMYFSCLGVKNR